MHNNKKCLVLLSHSSYSDIWELTMSSYTKFFEEKDTFDFFVTTDSLNDTEKKVLDKHNFTAIIYNKNITWGQSLIEVLDYLKKRNYELFLFSFDDLILKKSTKFQIDNAVQFLQNNNVNYLKLESSLKSLFSKTSNSDFFEIKKNNSYRGSLVFTLVDIKYVNFLSNLQNLRGYNAWEYEYKINDFIGEDIKCFSLKKSLIKYANTIIKGKLDPIQLSIAQRMVQQNYTGIRKKFKFSEILKFYSKTLLFRIFMFTLPSDVFFKIRSFKKQIINTTK